MAKGGILGSQNPIWGNTNTPNPQQQGAFTQGMNQLGKTNQAIGDYGSWLQPQVNQMIGQLLPGNKENTDLWNLTKQRYLDATTPYYEQAGTLTSGPGLNAVTKGVGDLETQFNQANQQLFSSLLGTAGGLESAIPSMYSSTMTPLFGAFGTGYQGMHPNPLQSMFSNLFSGMGTQLGQGAGNAAGMGMGMSPAMLGMV